MKIDPHEQGSEGWIEARLGVPSASCAARILTPRTRKPSAQQDAYIAALVAEHFLRMPCGPDASAFMDRGSSMERDAVAEYEFANNVTTQAVGFCTLDDGSFGCSPDRLVGSKGLLEVKALSAANHVAALLGMKDEEHFAQCQAQLFVTGRAFVDRTCYSPSLPAHELRIERDEEWIEAFADELGRFTARLAEARAKIAALMLGQVAA